MIEEDRDTFYRRVLADLEPGQPLHSPYIAFAKNFPPGVEDPRAIAQAAAIATANGCTLVHKPDLREVWFVKNGTQ